MRLEAATLSRICSAVTSRSNCAKDKPPLPQIQHPAGHPPISKGPSFGTGRGAASTYGERTPWHSAPIGQKPLVLRVLWESRLAVRGRPSIVLNVIPKRSFLTEYSCRIRPVCYPQIMRSWFDTVKKLGLKRGRSLDLDFHTIPFHGEDALVQKHYISKRSRKQKGVLAFVAQDSETRVFCYANSNLRKEQQNDEILRFVEFWKERTGRLPQELVFDSKLTTYANLNELNNMDIDFITLRRRSDKILEQLRQTPGSAWRQIQLSNVSRAFRTPKVLERMIQLRDYEVPIRQLAIRDLGHDKPTLLLTNQLRRSATKLIDRYAQRMLIENGIADGIDFFHMDALSSAVAMKVNCDLQLTLMASSLYRLLGTELGKEYTNAKSRRIFRDFIDATAVVTIDSSTITVQFQKRAHNPHLLEAGFDRKRTRVPWLGGRHLQLIFG